LLDDGEYLGSLRTMCRIVEQEKPASTGAPSVISAAARVSFRRLHRVNRSGVEIRPLVIGSSPTNGLSTAAVASAQ
jgi:hypothetical protein